MTCFVYISEYWLWNINILQNDPICERAVGGTSPFENIFMIYMLSPAICESTITDKTQGCMLGFHWPYIFLTSQNKMHAKVLYRGVMGHYIGKSKISSCSFCMMIITNMHLEVV